MKQLATHVREAQFLLQHEGQLRRFCKFVFSEADGSLYIVPYSAGGHFFYGGARMPEQQASHTFSYKEQLASSTAPKVSIHESGRVHVRIGEQGTGPVYIPSLRDFRGEHLASIAADSIAGLPPFTRKPRLTGRDVDVIVNATSQFGPSIRFVIYANGAAPNFCGSCNWVFSLLRPRLTNPLYFGIAPKGQQPLRSGEQQGVIVIAGWDPSTASDPSRASDFLYLRAE